MSEQQKKSPAPNWAVAGEKQAVNRVVERIARLAHEINRAYCAALGDTLQPSWELAPDWQKDSIRNGVIMHINNPNATPEDSHASWLAQKLAEGWVWGELKNVDARTHPCMLPYSELPKEQRVKDYLFKACVQTLSSQI